jgi:ribose transport system substrate-binding protein
MSYERDILMNRRIRAILMLVFVLAIGGASFIAPSIAQDRERVPVEQQEYVWVAANIAHPFYSVGVAGWNAAADMLGVQARLVGPSTPDVQQQVTMIEQAIANPNTAGILIYSVNDDALEPVLQQARDAGIPVITGNGELKNRDVRDAFVGTANTALGSSAADLVAAALGGSGKVGIVSFITAQNHQERVQGFEDRVAERYPDIEILGVAPTDGNPDTALNAAAAFLQAHPDVNLLWATDASSGAVAQAIVEAGLQGTVLSVGTDRTADQLAAIEDGTVYATITQDTFAEEFTALNFLFWAHNGLSTIPDSCTTKPAVISAENIDEMQ